MVLKKNLGEIPICFSYKLQFIETRPYLFHGPNQQSPPVRQKDKDSKTAKEEVFHFKTFCVPFLLSTERVVPLPKHLGRLCRWVTSGLPPYPFGSFLLTIKIDSGWPDKKCIWKDEFLILLNHFNNNFWNNVASIGREQNHTVIKYRKEFYNSHIEACVIFCHSKCFCSRLMAQVWAGGEWMPEWRELPKPAARSERRAEELPLKGSPPRERQGVREHVNGSCWERENSRWVQQLPPMGEGER